MKPKSIKVRVSLDKPSRRLVYFEANYIYFKIEDIFLVCYGLNYNQVIIHYLL
jgi:hypoxanthine-guanine phosphoribosyltransferase